MANTLPTYYAQETLRMVQKPQSELQSLLSDLGLSHALLDSDRIEGEMDVETYGRLFMALIKLSERDLHQDPDPILDLSTYRLMFGYMLQADCLEDAIKRAARYYLRFHAEQHSFSLEQSDDSVHWHFHLGTPDDSHTHYQPCRLQHGNTNLATGSQRPHDLSLPLASPGQLADRQCY